MSGGFHRKGLVKPDGRGLWLYARQPLPEGLTAPQPNGESPVAPNPHLRWHPLRGEWVAYAGYRQNRTFLPPPEWNPLAPTVDPANPTEVPSGPWEIAVFENRFPTLSRTASVAPHSSVDTRPGKGACEVVVFTQDPKTSLGQLPLSQVELLLEVWADRTLELGARDDVEYVFPFENRGLEVGVTLHHPHGQIYAYPFVPPLAARQLEQMKRYWKEHHRGLFAHLVHEELADGRRLIYRGEHAVAFMPVCARYPYEVWVAPKRGAGALFMLTPEERLDLARALKTTLLKYDGLWQRPMPYILSLHQRPTDGKEHPEAHAHFELYPAYRMQGRLKYLAGSEMGAGVFTADTLPEEKVKELQAVEVTL